ncbi:MAG: acetyl-CoA carboxylase biotin carboxyl carrier protein [Clostridiales bacterium]|nr:acetyl-CoA carboxylase biotin carboxyl carrier protein [Clostridiales bacterium]
MTNQEIYDLIARFDHSSLQTLRLSKQDFSIELSRSSAQSPAPSAPAAAQSPVPAPAAPAQEEYDAVTSPLVGAFYLAPAPDQPPYVQVGDRVKKGQTLCLIEAMKMMSEIPAPCDCIIQAVLKEDGELVAFGDALVRYLPC